MTLFINIIIVDTMIRDINKTPHTGTTIYINMYIYINIYIIIFIYVHIYVCLYVHIHMYVYTV